MLHRCDIQAKVTTAASPFKLEITAQNEVIITCIKKTNIYGLIPVCCIILICFILLSATCDKGSDGINFETGMFTVFFLFAHS